MKLLKLLLSALMVLSEALGFIATFLIIGSVFGLGFTLAHHQPKVNSANGA